MLKRYVVQYKKNSEDWWRDTYDFPDIASATEDLRSQRFSCTEYFWRIIRRQTIETVVG